MILKSDHIGAYQRTHYRGGYAWYALPSVLSKAYQRLKIRSDTHDTLVPSGFMAFEIQRPIEFQLDLFNSNLFYSGVSAALVRSFISMSQRSERPNQYHRELSQIILFYPVRIIGQRNACTEYQTTDRFIWVVYPIKIGRGGTTGRVLPPGWHLRGGTDLGRKNSAK